MLSQKPQPQLYDRAYHQSLTKSIKTMTELITCLEKFVSEIQLDTQNAPEVIRAMLKRQVSYLTTDLITKRDAELTQQLSWWNHGLIKSLNLEIANLRDWLRVCGNVLTSGDVTTEGLTTCTQSMYQQYLLSLWPALLKAIRSAQTAKHSPKYTVVAYQELSPIDIDKVGTVCQRYCSKTKTGVITEKHQSRHHLTIKVYKDGLKDGRWQTASKTSFQDDYYRNDRLVTVVTQSTNCDGYGSQIYYLRLYDGDGGGDDSGHSGQDRFYCSLLRVNPDFDWEHQPCLRSYNIKNGQLHGWCYLKVGTTYSREGSRGLPTGLDRELIHPDRIQGKVSGLYNEGVLVEAMD